MKYRISNQKIVTNGKRIIGTGFLVNVSDCQVEKFQQLIMYALFREFGIVTLANKLVIVPDMAKLRLKLLNLKFTQNSQFLKFC
jgi:hypothetical protein